MKVLLDCGKHYGDPTWIEGTGCMTSGPCSKCKYFDSLSNPKNQAGPGSITQAFLGEYGEHAMDDLRYMTPPWLMFGERL